MFIVSCCLLCHDVNWFEYDVMVLNAHLSHNGSLHFISVMVTLPLDMSKYCCRFTLQVDLVLVFINDGKSASYGKAVVAVGSCGFATGFHNV